MSPSKRTRPEKRVRQVSLLLFAGMFLGMGFAHAAKLEIGADAPLWQHLGADTLLYLHIAGGTIGLLAGVVAIASRKGRYIHRRAGAVFLVSMFVTYLIGAGVAPFLDEGQRPNFIGGVAALYLLMTGWLTVRSRGAVHVGWVQYIGFPVALSIAVLGYVFMQMGADSPTGTVDGSPPHCLLYTSPSPRDLSTSRMPSSA